MGAWALADPARNDAALLAMLNSRLTGQLEIARSSAFVDGQFVGVRISSVRVEPDGWAVADEILRPYETPAPAEAIAKAFAVMRVSTASRERDEYDRKLQVEVYCEAMMQYPADVALAVLKARRKWFPTLDELQDEADKLVHDRRAIRRALR